MVIFHSYVSLPEGIPFVGWCWLTLKMAMSWQNSTRFGPGLLQWLSPHFITLHSSCHHDLELFQEKKMDIGVVTSENSLQLIPCGCVFQPFPQQICTPTLVILTNDATVRLNPSCFDGSISSDSERVAKYGCCDKNPCSKFHNVP